MEVKRQRNATYKLDGNVQIDDAHLGRKKPKKVGRGAVNKIPFAISVAPRKNKPIDTHLRAFTGFSKRPSRVMRKTTSLPVRASQATALVALTASPMLG
jgi:hypothetical protein